MHLKSAQSCRFVCPTCHIWTVYSHLLLKPVSFAFQIVSDECSDRHFPISF